jgi:hypothetical protein
MRLSALVASAFIALSGTAFAGEKQKYDFVVLSNPVPGHEAEYNQWYDTQHIYDLLHIEGFVAAQRFILSDAQLAPKDTVLTPEQFKAKHPDRYMIIWEIETDDLPGVFARIRKGLDTGTTVSSPAFDGPSYVNHTFMQLTKRFTAADLPDLAKQLGK